MILRCHSPKQGFVSIQVLLLLGITFVVIFSFAFLSFVAQVKMQFRNNCLTESINLQRKIIQAEKKLIALNPLSIVLSGQLQIAYAQLIAAAAVYNAPGAAKATADISRIRAHQLKLHKVQQSIIVSTQILIQEEVIRIPIKIYSASNNVGQNWKAYLNSFFKVNSASTPSMAVQSRTSGWAPEYELKSTYKKDQAVAFNWHFKYFTTIEMQKLLRSSNDFLFSCGTVPERKGALWSIEILKDKFY